MAFSTGDNAHAIGEINVTPLVDVMLVLLIIFMVTTASAEQEKLEKQKDLIVEETESLVDLNLPVTEENPLVADAETSKLVVVVDRQLRVFIVRGVTGAAGQKPIADCSSKLNATDAAEWAPCLDVVEAALAGNRRLLKEGLYLEGDADTPYGFMSGLLGRLRGIGVQSVDIVTNPSYARLIETAADGAAPQEAP